MPQFVAYYRVSTQRQGNTGLGLEAQKDAVSGHVRTVGGELLAEYQEIESGARSGRPVLEAALAHATRSRATLVIAKLDRLARNVHFISKLLESGVDFVAADMPYANKLTIQIIAAVAEYERELISKRTKAALKAAREKGVRLGNPRLCEARPLAHARIREKADAFAEDMVPVIKGIQSRGVVSLTGMAKMLTSQGILTQRKKAWTPAGVRNLISRARAKGYM